MKLSRPKIESWVLPMILGALLLVLWSALVRLTRTNVFPSPQQVLAGIIDLTKSGKIFRYARDSTLRVLVGFFFAAVLGIAVGVVMGRSEKLSAAINPLIQLLRPISPIAWIPVAIVMFGIGNVAALFLVFIGCFFPIVVATANSVRTILPIYIAVGRNFGLSRTRLFATVVLPAALPQIFTGLRIALGIGWIVLVAAEMVGVNSGLGYLVLDSRNAGKRYDLVVAGMLSIGLIGLVLDTLLRRIETSRWLRWGHRVT